MLAMKTSKVLLGEQKLYLHIEPLVEMPNWAFAFLMNWILWFIDRESQSTEV